MSDITQHKKSSSALLILCFKSGASFGSKCHHHPTYHPLVCTSNTLRAHKLGYKTKLEDPLQWCICCTVTSYEDEPPGPDWTHLRTGHLKCAPCRHQLPAPTALLTQAECGSRERGHKVQPVKLTQS